MTKVTMDFDRFFAEDVTAAPIEYTLFGETGHIPPKIPYGLVLRYQRIARGDSEEDTNNVNDLLAAIFGKDTVARWSDNPMFDVDKMTAVLRWAMDQYGLTGKDADTESPKVPMRKNLRVVKR
jgi:hypothetical protein